MTERDDVVKAFDVDDVEPSDDEIRAAALSDDEFELMQLDLSEDLIADEVGLVSDGGDMSAEEAAIHVIES